MKLRDVAKGTRAVKPVTFRLANAPPPPPLTADDAAAGVSASDPGEVTVGVRVLTVGEIEDVFERAQQDARAKGVEKWESEHPICRTAQMLRTIELACVDNDKRDEPFFASADEIRGSPEIGPDNIAYLFEQQDHWQDECSFGKRKLNAEEMISLVIQEAERPESAPSPFSRLRPGLVASCMRFMAVVWWSSVKASLPTTSPADTSSESDTTSQSAE